MLQGKLSALGALGGTLQGGAGLSGALMTGGGVYPTYDGPVEFEPSEEAQTAETGGTTVLSDISIGAVPSDYVGSSVARRGSADLTASGATVSVPVGYYAAASSKSVAGGTEGTPTASKSVSGHSATVTPTVTNAAGYIQGGTHAGTPVTVSASELVSGTYTVTGSGTHDVAEYASESVAAGSASTPATSITADPTISVSSGGLITVTASASKSVTPTVSPGWVSSGTAGTVTVSGSKTQQLSVQAAKTVTPTTSAQTAVAAGKYTTGIVTVAAIPPEYIVPSGTKSITASGTHDVTDYASASVAAGSATMPSSMSGNGTIVGALNNTMNVQGTITATPTVSAGYVSAGTSSSTNVSLQTSVTTLNATTYSPQASDRTIAAGTYTIGTQTIKGAPLQSKSVTTNGTVTADAGYYGLSSVDVSVSGGPPNLQAKTGIAPSTSSQTVTYDAGYDGLSSVQIDAMPSGSATAPSSVSATGASISYGLTNITLSKANVSITPTVTPGYVSSGTAGNATVYLSAPAEFQAETDWHPSTSDQNILAGKILSGTQHIKAVTMTNLDAGNIKDGVTVKIGDASDDDCVASVTGTYTGGGSSVKTATGTFTGNGTRTIDVTCAFEPDIVYFTSNPGTTASSGTVAAIIVRDMMTATRYRNNSTTNSHYAIPGIANLNTSGSSYSWRATYANSKVTLYCYSSNARGLLTNGRTYTYTFIKWT